jgi:glucose-1-phosphate cytidylyltransferase
MKVVILAGGLGTRLAEETDIIPKPMVEIGEKPIIWHIMKHYAAYGYTEFVIALGYKADIIKRYFLDYSSIRGSVSINLHTREIELHDRLDEDWLIHLVDTGIETSTGGRIGRLRDYIGNETFMLTYGDGVSNVDLKSLMRLHEQCGCIVTLTAVRPPARFGELVFKGDLVSHFTEKPQVGEGWINGGFMVMEPQVLDYIPGDATNLEAEVLEKLAAEKKLAAYRHDDFWQCMDTLRDKRLLDMLWQQGSAPWKDWK